MITTTDNIAVGDLLRSRHNGMWFEVTDVWSSDVEVRLAGSENMPFVAGVDNFSDHEDMRPADEDDTRHDPECECAGDGSCAMLHADLLDETCLCGGVGTCEGCYNHDWRLGLY